VSIGDCKKNNYKNLLIYFSNCKKKLIYFLNDALIEF